MPGYVFWEGTKDDKGQEVTGAGEVVGARVAAAGAGVAGTLGASSGPSSSQFTRSGTSSSSSIDRDPSGGYKWEE